jgi:hypothetical protein
MFVIYMVPDLWYFVTDNRGCLLMSCMNSPADLDVRTEEEFVRGHAPKAINVPVKLRTDAGAHTGNHLRVNMPRLLRLQDQ